ncbi:helix-turn-helix domain-containing protein [Autumnicola musiva]|uniref:Helix-turn-helix transcriptional regulator n=1 Tax=Autumnicola musiva TaxID=3075589 RepID=A0ABU3D808_9FLAO|nr:helix-turn-helix transcriptional regulator [Zunongwangia sp. F117]MDT0677662.1 helix-turn-helix transcriptional regulator [Zunongwangia sp. F117]
MPNKKPYRIKTISEFHRFRGLPASEHPLISVIDYASIKHSNENNSMSWVLDFYAISLKKSSHTKFKYGHQQCDFDEGSLFFMSPNQVFRVEVDKNHKPVNSGWLLLIHPEFIWGTALAKTIKQYDFFDYAINEALFLSPNEELTINSIVQNIKKEYRTSVDKFSKQIISTHIENLLSYSERFYNRQFVTREKTNHQILERLEKLLTDYFNSDDLIIKGLPSVLYVSEELNVSQSYLGSLLRVQTGQNTQQHIHNKLIEKAKERLSTTDLSISEVAYELGFEHSQSFSKLFKTKTNLSPLEFRHSFN